MHKLQGQVGFIVRARRWLELPEILRAQQVERFFAWINRNRRLAKDA